MSFIELGLAEELMRAINDAGYLEPTPIQMRAIPEILRGADVLAAAQTGTGKTASFVLPTLQRLHGVEALRHGRVPRALILVPTRELALQVQESIVTYGKHLPMRSLALFGGVGIHPQIAALRAGVDLLVATPGRLLDHVGQNTVKLSGIEILVLDEADRMLDMGFIRDLERVLKLLPPRRQSLLFSATFASEIRTLAHKMLVNPVSIEVAPRNATIETVSQSIFPVDRERKRDLLIHLIKSRGWQQVLVFTRTKHGANRLAEQLERAEIPAMAIHGNKSQGARTRALSQFKDKTLQVLVATDIAARGLDIDQLPHVVNFELPNVPQEYVHRIGRTGRAGLAGEAVSLVCVDELELLADIERVTARHLEKVVIAGFEPDPRIKAEPIQNGRQGQPRAKKSSTSPSRSPGHRAPAHTAARKPNQVSANQRTSAQRSGARGS